MTTPNNMNYTSFKRFSLWNIDFPRYFYMFWPALPPVKMDGA
jgi:hypothetical protein